MKKLSAAQLPLVTLGVPVYNGERYLTLALRSLLEQDYPNLEILISDNGSTDGTESICREFAALDNRIRYVKQVGNLGAKKNFEFLVDEAQGIYFAWCADDDVREPRFVSACVNALEHHPSAVVCNAGVKFLDEGGNIRSDWEDLNFETLGMLKHERMLRLVDHMYWVDMMGLIRIDALKQALPFESVWGLDVVLSMKLLGIGDFLKVPEVLFAYRVRSKHNTVDKTMELITGEETKLAHPNLDLLEAMLQTALKALTSKQEKKQFFQDYLRILVDTESHGPYSCWVDAVAAECNPKGRHEIAPFHIASHLLPSLTKGLSVDSYLDDQVRVILLGCPNDSESLNLIPNLAKTLKRKYPEARFILLGSRRTLAQIPPIGEEKRLQLVSSWRREAIRSLTQELYRMKIDLAIHPSLTRDEVALDICLTGSRAFRTFGFQVRRPNTPRMLVGMILKRFQIKDVNEAFTHLLPMVSFQEREKKLMEAIGLNVDCRVEAFQ